MHYLTVATCIKGEDDYIDDFITYHEKVAKVESFIFYDRDGDNLTNKFKGRNNIIVVKYPEPMTHHGSHAYTVKNFQGHSKWIAFIDCDEVLYSPTNDDVRVTLQEYEQYAQIQCAWWVLGNNFKEEKEPGSVYERFTRWSKPNHPTNAHSQGICDISRIAPVVPPDPHRLVPLRGQVSVDENHRILCRGGVDNGTPHIPGHTNNKLTIPHYYTKSKAEWTYKNNKLRADVIGARIDPTLYDATNSFANEIEDFRIKNLWDKYCK